MNQPVEFRQHPGDRCVDVLIGHLPFTSYIWPLTIKKPVLFPLRTARGTSITRGFPLEPRAGERVDHPHHVGMWFNHGDVNGLDFWNNSDAIPPADREHFATIAHVGIARAGGGADEGVLVVTSEWRTPAGLTLLAEETTYVFRGGEDWRSVDRITRLAARQEVLFRDSKEGTFAIRVTRALEQPTTESLILTDAAGRATAVPQLTNDGVTGLYRSSRGLEGDAVWATRGEWVKLGGRIGDEAISLVIFDHPGNPGYPTYWHARGYGLFAANPLGQAPLSGGKDELNLRLGAGESATFRHRVLIASADLGDDALSAELGRFTST